MSFMGTGFEVGRGVTQLKHCSKLLAMAGLVLGILAATASTSLLAQEKVNPKGVVVKGFLDRVDTYLEIHKEAAEGIPDLRPTDEPSKLEAYQAALTARIKLARKDAKPGDIFGDATPLFRSVIRTDAADRTKNQKRSTAESVPNREPLRVNTPYPEKVPVATMPPLMLGEFPRLPDGLEYRLMGDDLVLYDTKANLIVDFIRGAGTPIVGK
jgi:hypothetical protein